MNHRFLFFFFFCICYISLTVFNRSRDCRINHQIVRWALFIAHNFFKICFTGRLIPSGNSLKSHKKTCHQLQRVAILEGTSDITPSHSLNSELLRQVFCMDPWMWGIQRRISVKRTFSISPSAMFCEKSKNWIFSNKSCFIFTSMILYLLVNLKLAPSSVSFFFHKTIFSCFCIPW